VASSVAVLKQRDESGIFGFWFSDFSHEVRAGTPRENPSRSWLNSQMQKVQT
jgi:hypothetical protein